MKIGSYAYCIDNSGVIFVKIFQALGASYKKDVILGNAVFVTVRGINASAHALKDDRVKYKFRKGSVHRAMLVHSMEKFRRYNRTFIWFPRNAVVLVNKNIIPLAKRIRLGIPKEVVDEVPSIGALCPVVM